MTNANWPSADIPAEYLTELGRITVHWSAFESILDLCLMQLVGKSIRERRSWIIFAHMTFPLKIDILRSVVSELEPNYPALAQGFPPVLSAVKSAQSTRNRFLHAKWGVDPASKARNVIDHGPRNAQDPSASRNLDRTARRHQSDRRGVRQSVPVGHQNVRQSARILAGSRKGGRI
jgi:hypothetical protein